MNYTFSGGLYDSQKICADYFIFADGIINVLMFRQRKLLFGIRDSLCRRLVHPHKAKREIGKADLLGADSDMNLGFYATVSVINSKTKEKELSFMAQPLLSEQYGFHIKEYDIVDNEGNRKDAALTHMIVTDYHAIHSGYLAVQGIAGIHELKITVPELSAYGLKKTNFDISFLIDEDTREDAVEIILQKETAVS